MTGLLGMPDEILSDIVRRLLLDVDLGLFSDERSDPRCTKPDLCSLAKSSRRLNDIVQPVLMREASFRLTGDWKTDTNICQFLQTVESSPALADGVQAIRFSWHCMSEGCGAKVTKIMKRLYHLRHLTIDVAHEVDNREFCHASFMDINPLRFLRSLNIHHNRFTLRELARYMFLPKIEAVNFQQLPYGTKVEHLPDSVARESPVQQLTFPSSSHLPIEVHQLILSWPKALRTLETGIPGVNDYDWMQEPWGTLISTKLSPRSLSNLFAAHQDSLQSLKISNCMWPSHDATRLDVSMIKNLRYLECPASLFFNPSHWYTARSGFHALLPRSIEEVILHFEIGYGINYMAHPDAQVEVSSSRDEIPGLENNWLLEVAANKLQHTPNLKAIRLEEPVRVMRENYVHSFKVTQRQIAWEPPLEVANMFEKLGVELRGLQAVTINDGSHEFGDLIPYHAAGFVSNFFKEAHEEGEEGNLIYNYGGTYSSDESDE